MTQIKKQPSKRAQKKIKHLPHHEQRIHLDIRKKHTLLPPLPFPPMIQIEDLVAKLTSKTSKPKLARFPNAFIIYRSEYVQFLKEKGLNFPMTMLSAMTSSAWKQEPSCVKDVYTLISNEAEKLYKQSLEVARMLNQGNFSNQCKFYSTPATYYSEQSFYNDRELYTNGYSMAFPEFPKYDAIYLKSQEEEGFIKQEQFSNDGCLFLPHNLSISNNFETLDSSRLEGVSHDKIPTQRKITLPENKNDLFDITTDIFCEIDSALKISLIVYLLTLSP
ncbi:12840_t:CDS:2 [Dentiscutata erythropus]|uniref:12840_t:CDS:1 n=1 Tax=Dentiscutata erythropus TaxID=1348616 RepID=A0A9N9IXK4_9GLOM|nr:12840_t:CDS:2 [Dentiscutata erythropus]